MPPVERAADTGSRGASTVPAAISAGNAAQDRNTNAADVDRDIAHLIECCESGIAHVPRETLVRLRALLTSPRAAGLPEGWKVSRIDDETTCITAPDGREAHLYQTIKKGIVTIAYEFISAMLDAAPAAPVAGRAVAPVDAQAVAADGAKLTDSEILAKAKDRVYSLPWAEVEHYDFNEQELISFARDLLGERAAVSPATAEPCAHDYVRTDRVCTECGEKTATADVTLPYENVLHDLIRKIVPGLDSGDILNDARTAINAVTASTMTDAQIDAVWENIDTRGSSLYEPHAWEIEKRRRFARAVATGVPVSTPATADERPAFDAWLAAEYPDVAAAMKNEFTNPDVVESVDMARAAWNRASRPAAPADAISLLRKAHSTLASAALTQIRDGEAVWTEIGRFLDAAPAETRKTCMCSGLGPCERRTDGSCRVSAPANLASAVSRQVVIDWAVDRWTLEVSGRPLGNIHRRSLDDAWRQFIRHLGADDVSLLGPRHDDLIAAHSLSIPLPDSEGGEA